MTRPIAILGRGDCLVYVYRLPWRPWRRRRWQGRVVPVDGRGPDRWTDLYRTEAGALAAAEAIVEGRA